VEDQECRRIGRGGVRGGGQRELARLLGSKGLRIGIAQEPLVRAHLRGDIVARAVKCDDAAHRVQAQSRAVEPLGIGSHQRRQMRARAMPHKHNPGGIDAERTRLAAQLRERGGDIGGLVLDPRPGHETIVERGNRIAPGAPVSELVRTAHHRLVAAFPPAAMDEDHQRRGLRPGPVEIELLERIAAVGNRRRFGESAEGRRLLRLRERLGCGHGRDRCAGRSGDGGKVSRHFGPPS
jgi:hypothetical protein